MQLNIGCGKRVLDGWVNVDIQPSPSAPREPEIIADARSIPLPDGCADTIMAIHLWEHFHPWECDALLAEWRRLLKRGGKLILEMPNLRKCCENVLANRKRGGKDPDQLGMWGLYGDPRDENPYMAHKWGWTPETLSAFLAARGFREIHERPTEWHPAGRVYRDMRMEAIRS